jgi:NAD(P)-dependent dehydrogenase (short-subunit alcohol dehydrogenase family)
MAGRLKEKIVVVLGGARGIGFASAQACIREGALVAIGDVRPMGEAPGAEGRFLFEEVDATNAQQVDAFIGSVIEGHGGVDVLFNNVGRNLPKSVLEVEPEEFDDLFRVNVRSAYLGCRAVLPHMLERRAGSIINMSSNGGIMGRPADPVYNATKHAIVGLTRSLAVAYAHLGIRVNAICPGPIDTPMLRELATSDEDFRERLPLFVATTPAARMGQADEVAQSVVFLAGDESRFITGATLPVDGGKAAGVMPIDRYRTDLALFGERSDGTST